MDAPSESGDVRTTSMGTKASVGRPMANLPEDELVRLDEEARGLLQRQREERSELDSMASDVVKLNTLVLGILLSALGILARFGGLARTTGGRPGPKAVVLLGAGGFMLAISMVLGVRAYRTARLAVGPRAGDLREVLVGEPREPGSSEVRKRLIVTYAGIVERNRSDLLDAARRVRFALRVMSWGLVAVAAGTGALMYGAM